MLSFLMLYNNGYIYAKGNDVKHRICKMLFLSAQTFIIFCAADSPSGQSTKLSFLDCFKKTEIALPCVEGREYPTHLIPFHVSVCRAVSRTVDSKKFLTTTGTYSFREVQGWIGFLEGNDPALLEALADRAAQKVPFKKYADEFVDEQACLESLNQVFEALLPLGAASNIKTSLVFYDSFFDNKVIAPPTLHELFNYYHLDINDPMHREVFDGFARQAKSRYAYYYYTINHEKEPLFLRQEGNGQRYGIGASSSV